ncbi:MAG TPA: flotillin family protein, partial [Verrucomicrobiota bacterium]|nr:flotillin family protein [Verrucomicrobiota bacterium]
MFWLKLLIAFVVVVAMFLGVASLFCIRKIQPGRAGVKTGWGGIKVSFDWMIRIPLVQTYHIVDISVKKLEISRKGKDGL